MNTSSVIYALSSALVVNNSAKKQSCVYRSHADTFIANQTIFLIFCTDFDEKIVKFFLTHCNKVKMC